MALHELKYEMENALFGAKEAYLLPLVEEGNADAMLMLGLLYEDKGNMEQAFQWYQKAAAANCPDAYYYLGELYEEGANNGVVEQSNKTAENYYLKGVELGSVDAMRAIGCWYFHFGDKEKGLELIHKAADLGDHRSLIWLATCYRHGFAGRKSLSKGYEYAWKAYDKLELETW